MIEVGKFYTYNGPDRGISAEILQILRAEGAVLYVRSWEPSYQGDHRYLMRFRTKDLRCLSDDFVAFVTGQGD